MTRFYVFIFLVLSSFTFLQKNHAQDSFEFNEFTERILLFRTLEGDNLYDGLLAHEVDRNLYVSIIDLLESLGFETETSLASKIFKASTVSPNLNLEIKWVDCTMKLNKKLTSMNCSNAIIYEDELFVHSSFLEKTLTSSFQYLPFKSELRISTDVDFPKLKQLKRKNAKIQSAQRPDFDPGYERIKNRPQSLQNFYLDQQFSWENQNHTEGRLQYYSNFSTDLLQHEVQITSQGDNKSRDFQTWSIKRSFYGNERNKYLSTYQIGDVMIPSAELIGGPDNGTGLYLTNRDTTLINYGQREFEGNLRPNWEVELFVNENLFARQSPNEEGRYRFDKVPVQFGENNFRLEFYGPLGERKTEFITNKISSENLKKNQLVYESGFSFDKENKLELLSQTSYGLTKHLSTYLGYSKYNLFEENRLKEFAVFGLNGYLKNINYGAFTGYDFFNQAELFSLRSQFIILKSRLQLTYIDSQGFRSSLIGNKNSYLDKKYIGNMSTNFFGRASALYRVEHSLFEDKTTHFVATQNLILPIKRLTLLLENDLVFWRQNKIDAIYSYIRNQFRSSLSYDLKQAKSFSLEYRNRFKHDSSVSLSYSKNFNASTQFIKAGYQHRFKPVLLGIEASTDLKNEHSIYAKIRSSFGYVNSQKKIQVSSDLIATRGNVCAKVFYDFNKNGTLEPKIDRPMKDITLRWVQGNLNQVTDSKGRVFFGNLPMYTPLDIQLDMKSLEDPQLSPVKEGFRVHLQKGQCKELSFLLKRTFDFEGQVYFSENTHPKRLIIELSDMNGNILQKTRTDKEGYFLFESLGSQAYIIKLSEKDYVSSPKQHIIHPYDENFLDQNIYFDVSQDVSKQ